MGPADAGLGRDRPAGGGVGRIRSDPAPSLADELGIDPSPELAQYYQRVLHQQWSPAPPGGPGGLPPPAQLPADLSGFAGRTDALALLDQALDAGGPVPAVVITAVSGTAGVGKTNPGI